VRKIFSFALGILCLLGCLCGCGEKEEDWAAFVAEYRASKVAVYIQENERYGDFDADVVFLGDSLTEGYDVAKYYPQYVVLNRGIGGDTTVGLESRLQASLYDVQPKVAVMLIGANNMGEMMENYESILKGFVQNAPNTKIILLSLTSMSGEWGKNNQLAAYNNVQIKMLAEKYGFEYVDLYSALLNLETGEIYPEYTTDGGHLTSRGYEVLTAEITPAIEKALAQWQSQTEE
jgi:lysophospholipase L1-like esterase